MTAAYEVPVRLLPYVRTGVLLAAEVVEVADGDHYGRPLVELADEWYEKVVAHNRHEDLLKPAEAESLLAVLEVAMKYAIENNFEGTLRADVDDEADELAFALRADAIKDALRWIVLSDRLAFA